MSLEFLNYVQGHIDIESIMLGGILSLMFSSFLLAGTPKFILISVHDYNLPSFILSTGYFTGKRKAEAEVLSKYPNSGNLPIIYFLGKN